MDVYRAIASVIKTGLHSCGNSGCLNPLFIIHKRPKYRPCTELHNQKNSLIAKIFSNLKDVVRQIGKSVLIFGKNKKKEDMSFKDRFLKSQLSIKINALMGLLERLQPHSATSIFCGNQLHTGDGSLIFQSFGLAQLLIKEQFEKQIRRFKEVLHE